VLISRAMAQKFWPGENALGKRFRISFTPEVLREVVGIVGDVKDRGLNVLTSVPMIYLPLPDHEPYIVSLVVRGDQDPSTIVSAVTGVLRGIDPEAPLRDVLPLQQLVSTSLAQYRFSMFLFAALAGLAFLLAALGIYSVLAYTVRRRAQEIGIRMAFGARVSDILRLVVAEGMKPALAGSVLGAFGAYALGGVLSRLIFGVSPADPHTFAAAALLLGFVALLACLIPAYRAARVDPVTTLRGE
jgi:ABC-type antimicrobial peptide transport system permease subunit